MKARLRKLTALAVLIAAAAGLYYLGGKYLWPPADRNTIQTVGIIEAPEVNISSRIGGRIAALTLPAPGRSWPTPSERCGATRRYTRRR
jgi:hypothetical protein